MPVGRVTDPPGSRGKLRPDDAPRNKLWFTVPDKDKDKYPVNKKVEFDRDPGRLPTRDPNNQEDYYWTKKGVHIKPKPLGKAGSRVKKG